ncbi:YafY family transcriptional regulator [Streptacidiphilus sp. PB12-B1b]|uniref:helix-turn-helix transcriptional regulator n=1 Tax=Streptacidiphilus sp. PB12-B1b TaxID=2705012 RepID=UPI0015FC7162|nr:YafY family protein [Streptacidiphilus sp. PB12-B1b]QMU74887.1 YafY family transcriptional regulator [Streptacidiphilus sp. PB12-B1b]
MTDTPARLLTLLSLLQTPREWPGSELAARLSVSPRTIRRDIDRLRELGYPVEATMGPVGGYRLVAGKAMPPLLLDDDEAVAIAVGLRTAAGRTVDGIEEASVRALAKLQQVLPSRLRQRVGAISAAMVSTAPWPGPTVDPEALTVLASGVAAQERLRFGYRAADGSQTRRLVEPHRLVAAGRRWYLVAYDDDRADWRLFRVDRITAPALTGARAAPRELPGGDAAAYVAGQLTGLRTGWRAVAVLHAPAAELEGRLRDTECELEPIDAHSCRMTTRVDSLEWLAFRLAMLGCGFEVVEPPELLDYLDELGERVSRAVSRGSR